MNYSNIPSAQTVILHCKSKGIKNIVISPGSRNAPLTIGFTEDPYFTCFSIVDERCAGFFALGIAQQQREAVAVLCTSGSALLNYYPAVAEAFYSDIPLVVISADRPGYKIDIGDGQTIRQDHVFERHIGYSANLKQDVVHATDTIRYLANDLIDNTVSLETDQSRIQAYNHAELHRAIYTALDKMTPVHINVPLEEPLYERSKKLLITSFTAPKDTEKEQGQIDFQPYADVWNTAKKKMVLVGVNHPDMIEQKFLDKLMEDDSVIVFTETTSNIHHTNFFPSIDSIIAPIEKSKNKERLFQELQPDILLTFGGLIVSKKIKAFLRSYKPVHHWHIDVKNAYDTFFCLSHHFEISINTFFKGFLDRIQTNNHDYYERWCVVRERYKRKRMEYVKTIPFSDMWVFHTLSKRIPNGYQLHLANSSTVRYTQLFDFNASIRVFCNRGTSGIDGSTSTALGASYYGKAPTLFVTGDLSFFYDSNGLWNPYIRADFRMILINNQGGGIFRILPGDSNGQNFETFFETTHAFNASDLCGMYAIDYTLVDDKQGLEDALSTFFMESDGPKLLEIKTPRLLNDKILLSYFDFIS